MIASSYRCSGGNSRECICMQGRGGEASGQRQLRNSSHAFIVQKLTAAMMNEGNTLSERRRTKLEVLTWRFNVDGRMEEVLA